MTTIPTLPLFGALALVLTITSASLHAQVPGILNYQGRVAVGSPPVNFEGSGGFKFALVDAAGTTTYWSNDGTSTGGSEPTAAVSLAVTKGLYSVLLGDTLLGASMTVIPNIVFANADVRLRVWFNDGTNGSQLLAPDQRLAAVGYAMVAGDVADGAITAAKIAAGAVGTSQLASSLTLPGTTSGTFSGSGAGLTSVPFTIADSSVTGSMLASGITLAGTTTGTFSGSGAALTGLNGSQVTSGTVGDSRLSPNVVLLDATQTLTNKTITGSFSGALNGNATTATTAGSATNFSGSLDGDVTGTQGLTEVASVGGVNAANVAAGADLANGSTNANTAGSVVRRDASGNFSAGTITANLAGNATNFTSALAGEVTGTQGATTIAATTVTGKALTGFNSAAGTVMADDTVLEAINKLDGNIALRAPLASPTFPGTFNAAAFVGSGAGLSNIPTSALTGTIPASQVATAPPGMVLIPSGPFTMGRTSGDTNSDAVPTATTVSAFYMDVNEVTLSQWQTVQQWGTLVGGYTDLPAGSGKGETHPVQTVSWYDVVKWCNARSEREGKTPVYYTDDAQTAIYKTGNVDVTNAQAKWTANGYRLPTEAEWEKAARGGLAGKRFPWGDTISQNLANYNGKTPRFAYELGPNDFNAIGSVGGTSPATSPVGSFAANGYGLNDMAGNVWEWCWDWYGTPYAGGTDPRGPATGSYRVIRGGSWNRLALGARCAYRNNYGPTGSFSFIGFRAVLPPGQ